jgi:HlyD family secretion protein
MQGPNLFRQEALQHQFTSPEDLERPFKLLRVGAWLPLLGLGLICGTALVWAIVGRLPETVDGTGVLLNPGRMRSVDTTAAGQIGEVRIVRGQTVKQGDILATLNVPELKQQLSLAKVKLDELNRTDKSQRELEDLRISQEQTLRTVQAKTLNSSILDLEQLLARQEKQGDTAIAEQRKTLEANLQETRKLNEALKTKVESARRLEASRVITGDNLLQAETALTENNASIASLQVRITDLALKDTENKQNLVTQRGKLADLRVQRDQLDVRKTQLEQETALSQATRRIQIQEQADRIKGLEATIQEQGQVRSPYTGRVVEVPALPGQVVPSGTTLATIDLGPAGTTEDESTGLTNLAYFPINTGKRIQPGMKVRVSPSTVQRERFGSIIGVVKRVSEFPVTSRSPAAAVGNAELGRALTGSGGVIEVEVELEHAATPTGFKWTSAGPDQPLSAGTTTRTTVTVEERAPITYLLPILRGWLDSSPPDTPPGGPQQQQPMGP